MATTPFLGCKISLISKSEIRYEGILYTIDPKESTIALAKVRSYGTEDRTAERQVPPRDEIFEYIIFRAGDIKDLIVDDPPASSVPGPGLADPAIIQAHSTSTSSAATFPSSTFPQMTSGISTTSGQRSAGPPFSSGTTSGNSVIRDLTQPKTTASNDSRSRNSTPTPQNRQSPTADWTETGHGRQVPNKENHRRGGGSERGGQQYRRGSGPPPHMSQNQMGGNKRGGGPPNYRQGFGQHNQHNHGQPQTNNRFGGSANYNRQFNSYQGQSSYQGGGRRPQSRPQTQRGSHNRVNANRAVKEPLKFEEDFDFDKANEDFKEIEEKMSNLKVEVLSSDNPVDSEHGSEPKVVDVATNGDKEGSEKDDHCYDKTKSFFDHISCEAIEREKGNVQRIDWKAERKLNSETFGVSQPFRRYGYGYGRGRGYGYGHRGYGGFRGSRGGYNRGYGGGGGGDGRRFNQPAVNRT